LWSRAIVGPDCTARKLQALGRPLTAEEVGAVRGRQVAIYAWGEARYKDIYGKDRLTEYRLIFGGAEGPNAEGLFEYYHEGNKAT
jgi:hypothetical protein